MMQNLLAEAHRDLADVDKEAEAEDRENETRIKLAVMAKMMKATISTAFQTWRENTFAYGVRRKLTVEEALAEKERMLKEFKDLVNDMLGYDGEWYNDDNHYKDAMTWSLDTKAGIIVKYREIRGERFRRLDPDAKQRILNSKCILWAREGTVYQIISNTKRFPWHAVAQGEVSDVMLRPDLTDAQAQLAWEAIEANYRKYHLTAQGVDIEGQHVEHVSLRGLSGKIVKLEVGQTLMGSSLSMEVEKTGLDGVVRKQGQGLGPESIRLLMPALRRNPSLTKLDLSRSVVGPELARELSAILRRCNGKNFCSLHIRGSIPLGRARNDRELALTRNTAPQHLLQMNNSAHTGSSGHCDSPYDVRTNSLAAQSLRTGFGRDWEPCDVEGGIAIATFLQDNRGLRKLDLEGNCIGPEGAAALADVLTVLTALTVLNLRDNNIGEQGATCISSALQKHVSLVELDLRENRMGVHGLASLVPAIQVSTCLVKLNELNIGTAGVHANSMQVRLMTDPGYEMVFVNLKLRAQAETITYLDLAENGLGFEGARLLSATLPECRNLEGLDVRNNALRSAGVVVVADAFPVLRKLWWLDLSNNLINTPDDILEVANVLTRLVALQELHFLGNIEKGIGLEMCCPANYGGSYRALKKALPNTKMMSMTGKQSRSAVLTFFIFIVLIVVFFVLSAIAIYMYNVLSYNELGYAKAVGTAAILVLVALFLYIWVLYRRIFSNLGITHLLATFMHRRRQEALEPRRRRRSLHISNSDLENGHGVFSDDELAGLSDSEREIALRYLDGEPRSVRVGSMRHQVPTASFPEEDEMVPAVEEPDEAFEFAMKLDPKIARKVPMLLEQYILRTAVPGSVDMDMWREHARMLHEFGVHSFFHSNLPLTLALRKPLVQLLLLLIVVYYTIFSALLLVPWYMETEALPLLSYRLVVTKLLNGSAAVTPNVRSFHITSNDCFSKVPLMDHVVNSSVVDNTIILELDSRRKMRRWHLEFWGKDEGEPADYGQFPGEFKLEGCIGRNCKINARTHEHRWMLLGSVKKPEGFDLDFGGAEPGANFVPDRLQHMVVKERLTTWILRFVPVTFLFGFLALLCCALVHSFRVGRWIVIVMCVINMLLLAISGTESRGGGLDYVAPTRRWFSAFPISIWPMMIGLGERYLVHCILISALISPGAIFLCRHTYSPDLLPQFDMERVGVVNFDQFTVLPVVVLVLLVLLSMLVKYALYRAHTKLLVLQDEMEQKEMWEEMKVKHYEALVDVKRELDKFCRHST